MRRSLTIAAVCELNTIAAVERDDWTYFERWIAKLHNDALAADWEYRRACDSVTDKRHAARFRRALATARANLKAVEAAQIAARTASNRRLLEDDAAAKSA